MIFEAVDAEWRQGLYLKTDGAIVVDDRTVGKAIVLWHDTAPREVSLKIRTKNGECSIKNVWDTGDGVMHSWHNGAAMIVEETASGRRYRCNDGEPDDDFDDIIFRIELLK